MNQPPETEQDETSGPDAGRGVEPPESPQKVWPLFLAAAALAGFGAYFVFFDPRDRPAETIEEPPEIEPMAATTDDLRTDVDPAEFALAPGDRSRRVELRQVARLTRGEDATRPLTTSIVVDVHDAYLAQPPEDDPWHPEFEDGVLYFDRTYSDATVIVQERDRRVGREITAEVERLLDAASHRISYERHGKVGDYILTSSEAAQLRQTLALLRDAVEVLTPTFPREAVNVGESWTHSIPVDVVLDEDALLRVDGAIEFESTFRGLTPDESGARLAVVDVTLRSRAEGSVRGEAADEGTPAVPFRLRGSGEGVYRFDVAAGRLLASRFTYEQEIRFGEGDQTSRRTIEMAIEPVPSARP